MLYDCVFGTGIRTTSDHERTTNGRGQGSDRERSGNGESGYRGPSNLAREEARTHKEEADRVIVENMRGSAADWGTHSSRGENERREAILREFYGNREDNNAGTRPGPN